MEKFTMKRPVKADYIRKYGFEGERIWRFELLKYEEAKQAFDRRQANIKAYQDKIKNEEKAIRKAMDTKRTKELYPDVYEAGGERAIEHLAKTHNTHKKISERKPIKKSFDEFKEARKKLGLKSTQTDYQEYLVRIDAKPTQTSVPSKPKATTKKTTANPKAKTTAKLKATPKGKAKKKK